MDKSHGMADQKSSTAASPSRAVAPNGYAPSFGYHLPKVSKMMLSEKDIGTAASSGAECCNTMISRGFLRLGAFWRRRANKAGCEPPQPKISIYFNYLSDPAFLRRSVRQSFRNHIGITGVRSMACFGTCVHSAILLAGSHPADSATYFETFCQRYHS